MSKSTNIVKSSSPDISDLKIYHEDPASKLCIDDAKWNSIVQENLKKFEDDKAKAKELKLKKAMTI